MAAAGLLDPPGRILSGQVLFQGKDLKDVGPGESCERSIWQQISMVFQASMNVLNPMTRIKAQFLDAMKAHGVRSEDEAMARAKEMFERVKLPAAFPRCLPSPAERWDAPARCDRPIGGLEAQVALP